MKRFFVALFCASTSLYGNAILVTDPATLNTTDFGLWSRLGSQLSQTFFVTSTEYENMSGHFSNGTGQVVTACTSGCGFVANGGIDANDSLVLTTNGINGSAPFTVSLNSMVYGAGAFIQAVNSNGTADSDAAFTVRIQAFDGISSVLTETTLVTSDANGDAMFVGVTDLNAEITKVVFSLTDLNGNPVSGNFVLDKLYIQDVWSPPQPQQLAPGVSEPSMTILLAPLLLGLIYYKCHART